MAFDKDYPGRKDWRQPYRGSRGFDRTCRSRGSCAYCANGRRLRHRKAEFEAEEMLREFHEPPPDARFDWDEWAASELVEWGERAIDQAGEEAMLRHCGPGEWQEGFEQRRRERESAQAKTYLASVQAAFRAMFGQDGAETLSKEKP